MATESKLPYESYYDFLPVLVFKRYYSGVIMSRQNDIKKLISKNERRLQKLKEQNAKMGLNTPAEILTEIEDIEAEIDALKGH